MDSALSTSNLGAVRRVLKAPLVHWIRGEKGTNFAEELGAALTHIAPFTVCDENNFDCAYGGIVIYRGDARELLRVLTNPPPIEDEWTPCQTMVNRALLLIVDSTLGFDPSPWETVLTIAQRSGGLDEPFPQVTRAKSCTLEMSYSGSCYGGVSVSSVAKEISSYIQNLFTRHCIEPTISMPPDVNTVVVSESPNVNTVKVPEPSVPASPSVEPTSTTTTTTSASLASLFPHEYNLDFNLKDSSLMLVDFSLGLNHAWTLITVDALKERKLIVARHTDGERNGFYRFNPGGSCEITCPSTRIDDAMLPAIIEIHNEYVLRCRARAAARTPLPTLISKTTVSILYPTFGTVPGIKCCEALIKAGFTVTFGMDTPMRECQSIETSSLKQIQNEVHPSHYRISWTYD